MNRTAGLLVVSVLVFLVMGPVTALLLPVAGLDPKSGPAGTEVTVSVSEYSPNTVIEVHEDTVNGALIGTGVTDGSGIAVFPITIPVSAATRSHLLYICGLCSSEYPEWATRGFQVTGPALATTTSTATTIAATTAPTSVAAAEPEASTAGDEPTTTIAAEPAVTAEVTATTSAASAAVAPVGEESGSGTQTVVWILGILIAMLVAFGAGTLFQARQGPQTPPPPPY